MRPPNRLALLLVSVWLLAAGLSAEEKREGPRYRIAYATYLGGSQFDQLREVIVYPDGSLLVGGQTNSSDLATTPGVVQPALGGKTDAFVVKLVPQR